MGLGTAIALSFTGGRQVFIESVAHLDGPRGRVDVERTGSGRTRFTITLPTEAAA